MVRRCRGHARARRNVLQRFGCEANAKSSPNTTLLPVLAKEPKVDIRDRCYASRLVYDKAGNIVHPPKQEGGRKSPAPTTPAELPAGQVRKETEGVFVMRDTAAEFVPVQTGIAGERYFEVLSGIKVGDKVITGPFNSVRDLQDGDEVRLADAAEAAKKKS